MEQITTLKNLIDMSTEKFQAQAMLCLSNRGGIAIELSDNGEAVRYQWYDEKPSHWCRICFNQKGEHYFKAPTPDPDQGFLTTWYDNATNYPEDHEVENMHFKLMKQILGL